MFEETLNTEVKPSPENEKNASMIVQMIVDGWLSNKGAPLMAEVLKDRGVENKPGLLYNYHFAVIQDMIAEEFQAAGFDLKEEVAKHGEEFKPGELSEYEQGLLALKIGNVAGIVGLIQKRMNK